MEYDMPLCDYGMCVPHHRVIVLTIDVLQAQDALGTDTAHVVSIETR